MSSLYQPYADLIANEWVPNTAKGVHTHRYCSLSLCLFRDGQRVTCVQGYGRTLIDAQVDAVREAEKWLLRHVPTPEESLSVTADEIQARRREQRLLRRLHRRGNAISPGVSPE